MWQFTIFKGGVSPSSSLMMECLSDTEHLMEAETKGALRIAKTVRAQLPTGTLLL